MGFADSRPTVRDIDPRRAGIEAMSIEVGEYVEQAAEFEGLGLLLGRWT
jgi:hypothetical protein